MEDLLWFENRVAGDANDDSIFNSSDLVQALQAGKYESAESAIYEEGDWNGDGHFDSADLVFAFQAGSYVAEAGMGDSQPAAAVDWFFVRDELERRRIVSHAQVPA